ncbi:putative baseplate assembly protein [Alkalispirochaeta americana]|uniref:putative baseplate assembly protein n=1 Tax=Alkalispirochaeta americana TaxID=159291 RepID=UPI000A072913|nr:putative baseplate assembly protein [Alkalispirochaeta americana]
MDDRTYKDILNEALRLIPHYCPEWTNHNPSDPGMTLVELFAWMTEMTIYRLNKVPEKTYLALIDLLGLSLIPPQPSRALVTFFPVESCPEAFQVKGGFQVSAGKGAGDGSIIFETVKDLTISPARLASCYAVTRDKVSCRDLGIRPFPLFGGSEEIERYLLVEAPQAEFLQGNNALSITFHSLNPVRSAGDEVVNFLNWEYWDGSRWIPVEAVGASGNERKQENRVFLEGPLDIQRSDQEGRESYWLRAVLARMPDDPGCLEVTGVSLNLHFLGEGVNPDCCLSNTGNMVFEALDLNADFTPFAGVPKHNDIFYVACDEILEKTSARISVRFFLSDTVEPPAANPSLVLKYEYWNGMDWVKIDDTTTQEDRHNQGQFRFTDKTRALTRSGIVSFDRPDDMAAVEVSGTECLWLRIRLVAGDFGKGGRHVQAEDGSWTWLFDDPVRSPVFTRIRFSYQAPPQVPDTVQVVDNYSRRSLSFATGDATTGVMLFSTRSEAQPMTYFGFDDSFPAGRYSLYFRLEERHKIRPAGHNVPDLLDRPVSRNRGIGLVWQYWNGSAWQKLSVNDYTDSFHQSGFLEFSVPQDIARKDEFGHSWYWLRLVFQSGSFEAMPVVEQVLTNSVYALNQRTYPSETIGSSSGSPDQVFEILRKPILSGFEVYVNESTVPPAGEIDLIRSEEGDDAIREGGGTTSGQVWIRYHEVDNFYASTPKSRHYIVDYRNNRIHFGDGHRGMIPPRGKHNIRAERLCVGGGVRGNVGGHTIRTLRESVPFLAGCNNNFPAEGGSDLESLESLKKRASGLFKSLNRAVTAEDYEWLAREASASVARAKCLPRCGPRGEVLLVIVPEADPGDEDYLEPPVPTAELRRRVKEFLEPRKLVGTGLRVDSPVYRMFGVVMKVAYRRDVVEFQVARKAIETALRKAFHPLCGGADKTGWPFGVAIQKDDIARVLESVDGVHHLEELSLSDLDSGVAVERFLPADGELPFLQNVRIEDRKVQF